MPCLPQSSNASSETSVRAGTEPLTTLKADWKDGLRIEEASAACSAETVPPWSNIANWSALNVT